MGNAKSFGNSVVDLGKSAGNAIVSGGTTVINKIADLGKSPPPPRPEGTWLPPPDPNAPLEPPPIQPDITNILNNIRTQFNAFLSEKTIYANNQISQVNQIFGSLSVNTLADVTNLVEHINNENALIKDQIDYNIPRINKSNIVNWKYKQHQVDNLKLQNYILYIVFYVLLLILASIMFYMNNTSFVFQTVVFHVLLIYPFLVYYFELFLYIIYAYSYSYLYGVPYDSVYIVNNEIKLI